MGRTLFALMVGLAFMATLAGQASAKPPGAPSVTITYEANCSFPPGFLFICGGDLAGTAHTLSGDFPFSIIAVLSTRDCGARGTIERWEIIDPKTGVILLGGCGKVSSADLADYGASGRVFAPLDSPFAALDGRRYRNSAVLAGGFPGTINGKLTI